MFSLCVYIHFSQNRVNKSHSLEVACVLCLFLSYMYVCLCACDEERVCVFVFICVHVMKRVCEFASMHIVHVSADNLCNLPRPHHQSTIIMHIHVCQYVL